MSEKYYLKAAWQEEFTEVSKEDFIRAERAAGFRPKGIPSTDPAYMTTPATAGFSSGSVNGRVVYK